MTTVLLLALALAGGLGSVARFVLDGAVQARNRSDLPVGTVVVNLSGSFLLGLLGGLALRAVVPESWHLVLGTGFLGGFTTFSAASVATVTLVEESRPRAALLTGLGMLVGAVLLAALGLVLGGG